MLLREEAAAQINRLLDILDLTDGDPDVEPWLGDFSPHYLLDGGRR